MENMSVVEHKALIIQTGHNAIHPINYYPVVSIVCLVNNYPLENGFFQWMVLSTRGTTGPTGALLETCSCAPCINSGLFFNYIHVSLIGSTQGVREPSIGNLLCDSERN